MFELKNINGGVTAILRVPIKNNKHIEYRRTYFETLSPDIEKNNDGALIDKKFGLGVMPLVKLPEKAKKHYRIALFDFDTTDSGRRDMLLTFWNGSKRVTDTDVVHRVREDKNIELSISSVEAYAVNNSFDRINIQVGNARCVLVPRFKDFKNTGNKFTFAVDFGTTNTHIEYSIDGNSKTFNISKDDKQIHRLHKDVFDQDANEAFNHNFVPEEISDGTEYTFPIRTVFTERKGISYDDIIPYTLVDGNVAFLYEKAIVPKYNNPITDMKWGGVHDKQMRMFLENICILMRNKVILNDGNLEDTKIIWFYPASMDEGRKIKFNKIWTDLYKKYFVNELQPDNKVPDEDISNKNVISISESAAPFQYYRQKRGAKTNVVTIDIGGGTTDVYVVEDTKAKILLSFRFASEAIFGDAYGWDSDENGYVNMYSNRFIDVLRNNKLDGLTRAVNGIMDRKRSPDIIAALFSLVTNKEIKGNEELNFLEKLSNNDSLRFAFIIFYGAILYHIATAMKAEGLKKPVTLAFSGNGSKTLSVLSSDYEMIARFAKLIFDGVYGNNDGKIEVIKEEHPKKATCMGGILNPVKQNYDEIDNLKRIFLGDNFEKDAAKKIEYSDITDEIKDDVVQQVSDFVDFLFQLHRDNNDFFTSELAADSNVLSLVNKICSDKTDLMSWLKDGLEDKSASISETLFFYPLVGALHEIAREISKM
jgi:hypothetical protein